MYKIEWTSDDIAEITLNGYAVASLNHDELGWAGMTKVVDTVTRIAELTGEEVEEL